jgi:hypothetical protein
MRIFIQPSACAKEFEVKRNILASAIILGFVAVLGISAQGTLPLYGNSAASSDHALTIESMLTYAVQDEYLARAEYVAIMTKFGQIPPYSNIKQAEEQHIAWLKDMFASLKLALPVDVAAKYIHVPSTLKEAAQAGVQAEINNIAMYNRFLAQPVLRDPRYAAVADLFTRLRDASSNHLAAFRKQLEKY